MLYCERCKRVFEAAERCPSCGGRKLRPPLPEDPCFLTETDPMFGGMLKDVLEQNRIPVFGSSTLGAGLALRVGSMFERVRFCVPFERLPEAEELVEALFRAPAEDGPAFEDE